MSSKYKAGEDAIPHFATFSVVGITVRLGCFNELLFKRWVR
jgi:hypothetical protein